MPIISGSYVSPTWNNGAAPAIDKDELQDITDTVAANQTPPNHADQSTTYGVGTIANYGHLKLSDSADSAKDATAGTAVTPAALFEVTNESGHYTGTGTYGPSNPTQITVKKKPSLVVVGWNNGGTAENGVLTLYPGFAYGSGVTNYGRGMYTVGNADTTYPNHTFPVICQYDNQTKKLKWWYGTAGFTYGSAIQCNSSGNVYSYTVIY